MTIKIVRPGYGPRKTVADRALLGYDGWDYVLGDGGTMESLNLAARPFAAWAAGEADQPIQTPAETRPSADRGENRALATPGD